MSIACNIPAEPPHEIVIVVDRYSKKVKERRFSDLPDEVKYEEATITCDGKEQTVKVPVAEIRVATVDAGIGGQIRQYDKRELFHHCSVIIPSYSTYDALGHCTRA